MSQSFEVPLEMIYATCLEGYFPFDKFHPFWIYIYDFHRNLFYECKGEQDSEHLALSKVVKHIEVLEELHKHWVEYKTNESQFTIRDVSLWVEEVYEFCNYCLIDTNQDRLGELKLCKFCHKFIPER